jgi:hypothetical protein
MAVGQQCHQKHFDPAIFANDDTIYVFDNSVHDSEIHGAHLPIISSL